MYFLWHRKAEVLYVTVFTEQNQLFNIIYTLPSQVAFDPATAQHYVSQQRMSS